jgi:protein SCO1/2
MLRVVDGRDALRRHFGLGVNFIESLVNRHRVELYIVDAKGRVAASFTRLLWDEQEVVACAAKVGAERTRPGAAVVGSAASLGLALLPKCPVCWAAYLSMLGIAGGEWLFTKLTPLLAILMAVNVASVWRRRRGASAWLVTAGALAILASRMIPGWESAGLIGVPATVAGSIWSVMRPTR